MQDKLGEIFIDGKILNLDNSTIDVLDRTKSEIQIKQKDAVNNINTILESM
jgi:hypothetical protein